MINILYEPFPDSITADGQEYEILTDFREWLRFADMVADQELSDAEKMALMSEWLITPTVMTNALVNAMYAFYKAKELSPDPPAPAGDEPAEDPPRPPAFDWKIDARFLLGDFRHYYGIDLLTVAYMHWYEFQALFAALPDDSMCGKRIEIRQTDLNEIKDKARRNQIARIQRRIALPFEYNDEMIGAMLWNSM